MDAHFYKADIPQICLVSQQTLPVFMGACLFPTTKTTSVHLLVTDEMKDRGDVLQSLLERRGVVVFQHWLADTGGAAVVAAMEKIYESMSSNEDFRGVGINVTCGTKLMAFAALLWATQRHKRADCYPYYVDTQKETIHFLIGDEFPSKAFEKNLKVDDILEANGFFIRNREALRPAIPVEKRRALRKLLGKSLADPETLGGVNKHLRDAQGQSTLDIMQVEKPFFDLFVQAGYADYDQNQPLRVLFRSEESRKRCNGTWIEEYVHAVLLRMFENGEIDDWCSDFYFYRNEMDEKNEGIVKGYQLKDVKNEFDASFTARNRLFIIECKTSTMKEEKVEGMEKQQQSENTKPTNISYKLDSLSSSGGVFTKGILVSANNLSEGEKKRFGANGQTVICGHDVLQLREKLLEIIR